MPFLLAVMLIPNFPRRTDMLMAGLSVFYDLATDLRTP